MTDPARLHPEDVPALARALAEALSPEAQRPGVATGRHIHSRPAGHDDPHVIRPGQVYATKRQLARRLGVSEDWIEAHEVELGITPLSDDRRSPKRFHIDTADEYMAEIRRSAARARGVASRRRRPNAIPGQTRSGHKLVDF
jgi:hypothetical protein